MIPAELAVGNIVRRVLHIIREEDFSSTTVSFEGLAVTEKSDDEDDVERKGGPMLSAAVVAAAARSTLRPRSLQTILEDWAAPVIPSNSSSGGDSEGKSKCRYSFSKQ
jgi:translation initiation factor eIF-2B subunit beta